MIEINPRVQLPKSFPILLDFYIEQRLKIVPPISNKILDLSVRSKEIIPSKIIVLKTITLLQRK
jgi:hypothetical protein